MAGFKERNRRFVAGLIELQRNSDTLTSCLPAEVRFSGRRRELPRRREWQRCWEQDDQRNYLNIPISARICNWKFHCVGHFSSLCATISLATGRFVETGGGGWLLD